MKSIKSLIQELNVLRGTNEYKSLSLIDDHITSIEDRLEGLEKRNMKYFVNCQLSANVSLATGAVVPWDVTLHPQFGNMHSNTVENSKVFIHRNGVYHISAGMHIAAVAGGTYRELRAIITRNGVAINLFIEREYHTDIVIVSGARSYYCYIGDYIEVVLDHDHGGNVTIVAAPQTYLSVAERMEDLNPSEYGLLNPEANTR